MDPNPETNTQIHHFTHQHPLNQSISSGDEICSGCCFEIASGNDYYACKTCNSFSLHKVCFHLPRTTTHPAHPDEKLNLAVISSPSAMKCRACTKTIADGFYYGCGGGICYHNLCLTLPLSVMVSGHPHPLKIQFSPPYDFSCDLCAKPSYKGWLYRCRFCEFDAHIACAISHKTNEPAALPENLTRQISNSARNGQEILQLLRLRLGILKLTEERPIPSDRKELATEERPNRNELASPHSPRPAAAKSPISPASVAVADIPSYQFSDLCFSIDLHKSFSGTNLIAGQNNGERKLALEAAPAAGSKNWCDSHTLLQSSTNGKMNHKEEKKVMNAYGIHGSGKNKKNALHDCDENRDCSCWWRIAMLCCAGGEKKKCLKCSANR
ncbi:hypothetical protein LINPERPRIM_LOCUS16545 [Linum perenne]